MLEPGRGRLSIEGLIVKAISGFYTVVLADGSEVICRLPGRLKQEWQQSGLAAVGDRVNISLIEGEDEAAGLVEEILPRRNALSRSRPVAHSRQLASDQEQVLVANIDQVIFVFSLRKPATNLRKLDRMLVVTEKEGLPAVICVNKIDLGSESEARAEFQVYADIGYPLLLTSARTGAGVAELAALLQGKISVLAGSSGVGKSSLLNAVQPGLGLKISQVSKATEKGLHTTRFAELIPLERGGYVADTPGIRGWALYDIEPDELDGYFREIAPLVAHCQFSDCTHEHEPGCAVQAAVKAGKIAAERVESYHRLREEHEALMRSAY